MPVVRAADLDAGVAHGVSDTRPREAVRLGEGAQHDDVRVPRRDHTAAVDGAGLRDELGVGLVEDHEHIARHAGEERVERVLRDDGTGRIVRTADDDHARPVGDGIRHRIEVMTACGVVGHRGRPRAGDRGESGVGLERAPREEDLVAGAARGLGELVQDRHRSGGDVHRVVGDAVALPQAVRAVAATTRPGYRLNAPAAPDSLDHPRQRVRRGFSLLESLNAFGPGLPALLIGVGYF